MKSYKPAMTFDEEMAEIYDEVATRNRAPEEVPATVAFLEELARGGPVLELAIGTGRIALPLAARGVPMEGIDISPAMVAKLRAKPGGEQIPVTIGDYADVAVTGTSNRQTCRRRRLGVPWGGGLEAAVGRQAP